MPRVSRRLGARGKRSSIDAMADRFARPMRHVSSVKGLGPRPDRRAHTLAGRREDDASSLTHGPTCMSDRVETIRENAGIRQLERRYACLEEVLGDDSELVAVAAGRQRQGRTRGWERAPPLTACPRAL